MLRRTGAALMGAGLLATALLGAQSAVAAPADKTVMLTSQQLTDAGFPKSPNTTAWGPGGTASLPIDTAAQWQDVVITGKAPSQTKPGQLLTMSRFVPTDTTGSGSLKAMNITAVVQPNLSYTLHFQLGYPGTYGYVVGYQTTGNTPELIGFQFQFTTTGGGAPAPKPSSAAVTLSSKKLAKAGFTKTANTVGWPGTATLSTSKAKAGTPVTISGTTKSPITPGTVLTLNRFTPTDKKGSGSFTPVGNTSTIVAADGTFSLTFEINEKGLYGYDLLAQTNGDEALIIEFQLKTT